MRRVTEFVLLLFVCGLISFLLHWHTISRPTLISGTVVDSISGQPVPGVMVRSKTLNGSSEIAWTDTQGHFTAVVEDRQLYRLYVAGPRFGSLLQSTFVRTVPVYTRGEQHSGVIVPAIPGAELSGHVYDEGATPLPGCEVWALTDEPDSAQQLREVNFQLTDGTGAFAFRLGADRYFVLVRCHRYLPGEKHSYNEVAPVPWTVRNSWQPMLFPQAASFDKAKAIALLPGDRRRDVNFHLQAIPQYSICGKVILSDGSRPRPRSQVMYIHNLQALPLNPALAATAPNGETCDWDANSGIFHCDFLSPGAYKLSFSLEFEFGLEGNLLSVSNQRAEVDYEIKTENHPRLELTVRLQEWKPEQQYPPSPPKDSFLRIRYICSDELKEAWIGSLAWSPATPNLRTFDLTRCAEDEAWPVAAGDYTVFAYQSGFFGDSRSPKILTLLRQHGKQVSARKGKTTHISVPVWSTNEMIRWAVAFLHENR